MRKNLEDVARLAGVGIATVDRVLNERGGVSPSTAIRVIEAARQLKMKRLLPSPYSRRLRFEIIMITPDSSSASRINATVESLIPELGSAVTLQRRFLPAKRAAALAEAISESKSNALIVFAPETAKVQDAIAAKTASGVPVVTILSDLPTTPRLSYVGIDHLRAGRAAAFFLVQMLAADAETLIACSDLDYRFEAERVAGFRQAWSELGAEPRNVKVVECARSQRPYWESVAAAIRQIDNVGAVYSAGVGSHLVEQGLISAGQIGRIKFIAHELDETAKRLLLDNKVTLVIDQNLELQIARAVDHFRRRFGLEGDSIPDRVPFQLHIRDNLL
ncbi:LacI family DNA-binding transcriptional regulator [Mesorhizobium sp. M0715]|uniref:LacI family DNA-binding transcriptional regulator n=1 Tax=Mesorhizobium sp. M0715 TaxID=2956990 RepID=UPI003336BE8F